MGLIASCSKAGGKTNAGKRASSEVIRDRQNLVIRRDIDDGFSALGAATGYETWEIEMLVFAGGKRSTLIQ